MTLRRERISLDRGSKADVQLQIIISSHNSLGDGRYYDVESSSSFDFDHATQVSPVWSADVIGITANGHQKASGVQSHPLEGAQSDLV